MLKDVLFLGGYTPRSQSYAQAMAARGLIPQWTILFGHAGGDKPGQKQQLNKPEDLEGLFVFDPSVPLGATCREEGWETTVLNADSVNAEEMISTLRRLAPKLVIYSGYGGEIVSDAVLETTEGFLHVHPGWVPDYRGSTTAYFSWLDGERCGASAILLESEIDTGPILLRKQYAPPPPGVDVDYVYDPALRTDVLLAVLQHLEQHGHLPDSVRQQASEGRTFYIIHPLLKHIALMSRG